MVGRTRMRSDSKNTEPAKVNKGQDIVKNDDRLRPED